MNSKDYRNIREAYLNVYNDDLTEEQEFKSWVTELLDEGYDLSDYTWDEMYDIYNEARESGVKPYKGGPEFGIPYSEPKPLSGEKNTDPTGYGGDEKFNNPDDKIKKPGTTVPKPKQGGYGRIMSNIPHGIGDHATPTQSRVSTITRKDPGAPTSQKLPPQEKTKPSREIIRKTNINASYDLYDIILSHLLDEGYADTEEAAESIMVNMSEEWKESIVVEDIESRREMLKQQRIQQRISSTEAQKRKRFKDQDRESLKKEIIKALIQRQQTSTN
jgi:hypothetical protein